MRNNRVVLGLEFLEDRTMPSGANPFANLIPAQVAQNEVVHFNQIAGSGGGSYSVDRSHPDAGNILHLLGSAHLGTAGQFIVTGGIQSVGNVATGHATGQLTFRDNHGSFTIFVTGGIQHGISPFPGKYQYHVLHGTGAYTHMAAHGTVDLVRHPGPSGGGTYQINFKVH